MILILKERVPVASKILSILSKYFRQFSSRKGLLKLIIAMLLMISSFKLTAGYVHPHSNYEFTLFLISGLLPFFMITILSKLRYSIPLSLILIILFFLLFKNIAEQAG